MSNPNRCNVCGRFLRRSGICYDCFDLPYLGLPLRNVQGTGKQTERMDL